MFLVPIQALAEETVQTQVINEYEMIKSLKSKSDKELRDAGLDDAAIKEIREVDYIEKLKERAKLDEETLKNYGYSKEKIKKLKKFKGTEEEVSALAAQLWLSTAKDYVH